MEQLKKLTKVQITTLCKEHGVSTTSKQKKDELLENLLGKMSIEDLDVNQFASEKKSKKTKTEDGAEDKPKRKVVVKPKMSKKLKDNFDADLYDKELKQFKLKHVDLNLDQINALPDKEVVAPFKAYMKDFIKNATDEDIKRYVDSYGAVKLMVEYFAQPDAKKVSNKNEEEIYEVLGKYLFNKDESVYSQFAKFLKKELSQIVKEKNKQQKEKKKVPPSQDIQKAKASVTKEPEPEDDSEVDSSKQSSESPKKDSRSDSDREMTDEIPDFDLGTTTDENA